MQTFSKKPYLVTGASGFTGGVLVEYLKSRGIPVRVMVRTEIQAQQFRAAGVEAVLGDLQKPETLAAVVQGVAGVYHIAAAYRQATLTKEDFFAVNLEGTRRLLEAAIAAGVPRFIHCSTIGVVSSVDNPPGDETAPYDPADEYQRSKVEGEKCALEYFRSGRISGVVIRPAMIYGPGDTRLFKIIRMVAERKFFYVGDGSGFVHFIDVRDLARAFVLAMEHAERNAEVYIIAGAQSLTLKEFVRLVASRLGVPEPKIHIPVLPMQILGALCELVCAPFGIAPPLYRRRVDFFIKNRAYSTKKAREHLGYAPRQTLTEEIDDILEWNSARGKIPQKYARPRSGSALSAAE